MGKARRKDKESSSSSAYGGGGVGGLGGSGGQDEPKLYLEAAVLERKLQDTDLHALVALPPGLDYNEWLASHTIAFFEHVNLVYGTVSEFCTMSGCPDMSGPGTRTYLWFDEKGKKARVPAPQYIDYVMTFIQKTVSDETIFPTKYANEFPSSFESIVRKILRLIYHVLAHVYHCHFREVVLLNLHAQLNCVFAHLTVFDHHFHLIDPKETDVLNDLVLALHILNNDNNSSTTTTATTAVLTTTTSSCSNVSTNRPTNKESHHSDAMDSNDGVLSNNSFTTAPDNRIRADCNQDEPMVICDEPRFTHLQCFQPQTPPQPHRDIEHLSL